MDKQGLNPRAKVFCDVFVRLWRENKAVGIENPRVGRQAAMTAGYGSRSWNSMRAQQAADMMYNKLMKQPSVIERIRELGLERDGRQWREAEA